MLGKVVGVGLARGSNILVGNFVIAKHTIPWMSKNKINVFMLDNEGWWIEGGSKRLKMGGRSSSRVWWPYTPSSNFLHTELS